MSKSLIDSELSSCFQRMGLVAAIMVVCLHMGSTDCMDSSGWWFFVIVKQICKMAVPWFFFASGFFIVGHYGESGWYVKSLRSRVKSLLVPYVVWSVLFSIYFTAIYARNSGLQNVIVNHWVSYLGLNPIIAPFYSTMWYIRALMVFALLSPMFVVLVRKFGWWIVGFLWLADFVFRLNYGMPGSGFFWFVFSLEGAAYFACGIGIRLRLISLPRLINTIWFRVIVIGSLLSFLTVFTMAYRRGHPLFCYEGALIPCAMGLVWWLVSYSCPKPSKFDRLSFPLYLIFGFCGNIISAIVLKDSSSALQLLLRVVSVTVCSMAIAIGLKRYTPRLANLIFGGR